MSGDKKVEQRPAMAYYLFFIAILLIALICGLASRVVAEKYWM